MGGGNIPKNEVVRGKFERTPLERPKSSQPANKPQGIRDLIVGHLKNKLTTTSEAQQFLQNLQRGKNQGP